MISLRPYQLAAIEAMRQAIRDKHRHIILSSATGTGKTAASSAIMVSAAEKGKRIMFVAHRRELIEQTVSTLARFGVVDVSVIMANDKRMDLNKQIQICSIQTVARRELLSPPPDIIFIDECHLAAAKSYADLFEDYPDAVIFGLTATPARGDGKPLGKLFTKLIMATKYEDMIREGYLGDPITYGTPILPDLEKVKTLGGEYDQKQLDEAVNKSYLISNAVQTWLKRGGGLQTVAFCVSVAHSQALTAEFKMAGVKAEHLDGETPTADRAAILARLESGETRIVCSISVLVEGWDCPPVKCCLSVRPTKSLNVWMQSAGRILRPYNGIRPIILDCAGNVDRHGLVQIDRPWSLTEKIKRESGVGAQKSCKGCFAIISSALATCPHCGLALPPIAPASPKDKKTIPVDLAIREMLILTEAEKAWMTYTHNQARRLGWHVKALENRWVDHFSKPFPGELKVLISADYSRDDEWKAKRKARVAQKKGAPVRRT
jgi:DNA repair protein RadD